MNLIKRFQISVFTIIFFFHLQMVALDDIADGNTELRKEAVNQTTLNETVTATTTQEYVANSTTLETIVKPFVPTFEMNDGREIPILGLNSNWYARDYLKLTKAIRDGCRLIDTTWNSDLQQTEIGLSLKKTIDSREVKREEMFIIATFDEPYLSPEMVEPAIRSTLGRLKLDYLNLFVMRAGGEHSHNDLLQTWKAMEKLQEKGLALSIGVAYFDEAQLEVLMEEATVKPAVLKIMGYPSYASDLSLVKFAQDYGVVVEVAEVSRTGFMACGTKPKINAIMKKYGKTEDQVRLRNLIQKNIVAIMDVTEDNKFSLDDLFDFFIPPKEIKHIENYCH